MAKLPLAERVAAEVAALADLPREELAEHWLKRFGREPPKGCGRKLLELAAAYGIQEQAFGGLKPETRRALALETEPLPRRYRVQPPEPEAGDRDDQAWHSAGQGVERPHPSCRDGGGWVCLEREDPPLALDDCPADHRRSLVGTEVLRAVSKSSATLRCAIYTRKSTEEGLEQEFNSLDAQRESCVAYITSQASLGWKALPRHYDDGGISGGTMERPALQELLSDIKAGKIDVVVVYKIDRLTRSLMDFARIVEIFDAHKVSFVSVTQQFNTLSSMGRLTLNVLLSFAQFEREVTAERIRDKIAASKKKGMWMGGAVPLGYEARDKKLVIKPEEAEIIRRIFRLYLEAGSVRRLKERLDALGMVTKVRGQAAQAMARDSSSASFDGSRSAESQPTPSLRRKALHKGTSLLASHQPDLCG